MKISKLLSYVFVILICLTGCGKGTEQIKLTFPDGSIYEGEMKDDMLNGQGTIKFANGNKYVGGFKDSKYDGKGTLTFMDGLIYTGEWKDGKRHGVGMFVLPDGREYSGIWSNDQTLTEFLLQHGITF